MARLFFAIMVVFLQAFLPRGLRADANVPSWVAWNPEKQGHFISAIVSKGSRAYIASEEKGLWCLQPDGSGWKQCDPTGVTDDFVRSLAIDRQGRLWAGHGHHGVSVYNGTAWKNYDAPLGPLGHRVFQIAISPLDGDVWMATDLGLARYSVKLDSWLRITRADGLPADQVNAIAFDAEGRLFACTQCDGIAIAKPSDNYLSWKTTVGPDRLPVDPTGKGLPSNLINDVKIAADGAVFVATDGGLAVSRDHGGSWTFFRGEDCYSKVEHRTGGAPDGWQQPDGVPLLGEDYCACLAIDSAHHVWVGHRKVAVDQLDGATLKKISPAPGDPKQKVPPVTVLTAVNAANLWVGTGGDGALCEPLDADIPMAATPATEPANPTLPSPATIHARQFDSLVAKLAATRHVDLTAAFLGDDWVTRGDGMGRYGCQKVNFPFYGTSGWASGYDVLVCVGPSAPLGGPCYYFDDNQPDDRRVLYIPNAFKRTQGEFNDASFDNRCVRESEGPDLWLKVKVPDEGVHRLSLFFINFDGHKKDNRCRDYLIEVKDGSLEAKDADFTAPMAKARVCDFYQPVYKQFLLAGGHAYWIKINRNYSFVTKISGIFLDRVQGDAKQDIDSLPHPLLDADHWGPPKIPEIKVDAPLAVRSAKKLWDDLDARYDDATAAPLQLPLRLQAYQLALDQKADANLLANWKWKLCLWDESDRLEFCRQMDFGYDKTIAQNPQAAKADRVKMEELYSKVPEP
jgi:hypothetical protein